MSILIEFDKSCLWDHEHETAYYEPKIINPQPGTFVRCDDTVYVIDSISFTINGNEDIAQYRRLNEIRLNISIRNAQRNRTINIAPSTPLETVNIIAYVGNESDEVLGSWRTMMRTNRELCEKVTGGFLLGDVVRVRDGERNRKIVAFRAPGSGMEAAHVSVDTSAASPRRLWTPLTQLVLVERQ